LWKMYYYGFQKEVRSNFSGLCAQSHHTFFVHFNCKTIMQML